ncbi:hypothetical protein [Methanosphaera cuniculi]|uniref:hypothetical protein n=1 Tax=Methanosphaera cuniculi TaxID=1077256 RepID=UPI0026F12C4A|nr:hypothetical protein [Methanosphaera cuniculi]
MKPEAIRRMEEEDEDEEFIGLNVDSKLLKIVPIIFKRESEVTAFYDGFLETIQNTKVLRKSQNNRARMNEAFLNELLKYHDIDYINAVLNDEQLPEEELLDPDEEKDVDKLLRKTFKTRDEFRMFMAYISQSMMEQHDTPVEAAAKAMKRLGKTDTEILKVTSVIDKVF